jgi:hypothetical protein
MNILQTLLKKIFPPPVRKERHGLKLQFNTYHVKMEQGVILVVEISGISGYGCSCADTVDQIQDVIFTAFKKERPHALIYDLRNFDYRWGDNLTEIFFYHPDFDPESNDIEMAQTDDIPNNYPIATVISHLNRSGLRSLFIQEMDLDPEHFLFETMEDAVASVFERIEKNNSQAQS